MGCTGGDETKIDSTSDFNIALERAQGYAYPSDTMNLDTAHQMGLALLEHDSVKTNPLHRMEVLRLLTDVARVGLDYEEQVKWASQLATLCRTRHDETEALRAEALRPLSDGDWHPVANSTEAEKAATILPFRAYLLPSSHHANDRISMMLEDVTGIDTIETIDNDGTHRYYDLNGRELPGKPEKGIYIHNGKKFIAH